MWHKRMRGCSGMARPRTLQKAALALIDPQDLPLDPDTSEAQDRAGLAEPADELRQRRWRGKHGAARKAR